MAKLFADSSTIALTSFISPYRADRQLARDLHVAGSPHHHQQTPSKQENDAVGSSSIPFIEVHIDIPLEEAERRDPKGLYKKARAGEIPLFTGISAPYEAPENPEIHIRSDRTSVEDAVRQIWSWLDERDLLAVPL